MPDDILGQLTLEEKASLLAGADAWHLPAIERLGIRPFKMSDGPSGVRGAYFTGGPSSANAPCGTALAATFDVELVGRVAQVLGMEARDRGVHLLLAPTVNIHRTPLAGRNFECFSEDPYLAARMAVAYVEGVQSQGVGATVKHYVANDSEFERFTMSSEVDERTLREIYLLPFEGAVTEAGAWALMSAYNRVNGTWCGEHEWLLTTVLREDWGWDGMVVSDWGGTHTTAEALHAGLEVEMPGPPRHRGAALLAAMRDGAVKEDLIDERVRRVLLAIERAGERDVVERENDTPERRAVLRDAAAASVVLLKNDVLGASPVLPLSRSSLRRVAVVGPNAAVGVVQGGGSCQVWPYYTVSPLEGLESALGDTVEIVYELGCYAGRTSVPRIDTKRLRADDGSPGYTIEYRDRAGTPIATATSPRSYFRWIGRFHPDVDPSNFTARITTEYVADADGEHTFELRGNGSGVLAANGTTIVERQTEEGRLRASGVVSLSAGEVAALQIDYTPDVGARASMLELRCRPPMPEDALDRAAAIAAGADVAIVVVGTDGDWETEGRDRESMDLPGDQDDLVRRVVAANPRTAVVVNSGAPVRMDWAGDAAAIVQCWFAGQELGNALADVLTGVVNPSGRLPTTIPVRLEDTPTFGNYPGSEGRVVYEEGVFVGYRHYDSRGVRPRFAFGHGLSYSTFSYGELTVSASSFAPNDGMTVTVRVMNTGERDGAEVVQLYVRDVEASVPRPAKELKGFARVDLAAGASADVRFDLDSRAFSYWDAGRAGWHAEPGEFELLVGASSADIRTARTVTLTA